MANTAEEEIATFDFQTYGSLTLTSKRMFGRLRMPATEEQIRRGGGHVITTTKGKVYERDFDAPVSTIDGANVRPPMHPLIGLGIVAVLLGIAGPFFLGWQAIFLLPIGIGFVVLGVKFGKNPKEYLFSFVGNGEIFKDIKVPASRHDDIIDFVSKIKTAKAAALQ